jgi:hypothetical protein
MKWHRMKYHIPKSFPFISFFWYLVEYHEIKRFAVCYLFAIIDCLKYTHYGMSETTIDSMFEAFVLYSIN